MSAHKPDSEHRRNAEKIMKNNPVWKGYTIISSTDFGTLNRIQLMCPRNHQFGTCIRHMNRQSQCPEFECVNYKRSATWLLKARVI